MMTLSESLGISYIKTIKDRIDLKTPEFWFLLAAIFTTISWISKLFIGLPSDLQINTIMQLISTIMIYLVYGILIYFLILLSLYLDEQAKLIDEPVYFSNFIFSRLISPVTRVILLFLALTLLLSSTPTIAPIIVF